MPKVLHFLAAVCFLISGKAPASLCPDANELLADEAAAVGPPDLEAVETLKKAAGVGSAGSQWQDSIERASRLTAESLNSGLNHADPVVRGMAGLMLLENGVVNSRTIAAVRDLAHTPEFQNQKWNNTSSSASADARIQAIDALLRTGRESPEIVEALRSHLYGDAKDPAVMAVQLHVTAKFEKGERPPALVAAVKDWPELSNHLTPDRAELIYSVSGKRPPLNRWASLAKETTDRLKAERLGEVERINRKYGNTSGFHGAKVIRNEIVIFIDDYNVSIPDLDRYSAYYVGSKEIKNEFGRVYPQIAGYAGFDVDPGTKTITVYFDRTLNWGDPLGTFGDWKVDYAYVSPKEAEARRQAAKRKP